MALFGPWHLLPGTGVQWLWCHHQVKEAGVDGRVRQAGGYGVQDSDHCGFGGKVHPGAGQWSGYDGGGSGRVYQSDRIFRRSGFLREVQGQGQWGSDHRAFRVGILFGIYGGGQGDYRFPFLQGRQQAGALGVWGRPDLWDEGRGQGGPGHGYHPVSEWGQLRVFQWIPGQRGAG